MKYYVQGLASAVAVIAMQLSAATVAEAQTYEDVLTQVSTPGFIDGNTPAPPKSNNNDLPTLDSIFEQQEPEATAQSVPSAVVPETATGENQSSQLAGPGTGMATFQYQQDGQICNPPNQIINCPRRNGCGMGSIVRSRNIYAPMYSAPVGSPVAVPCTTNLMNAAPVCGSAPTNAKVRENIARQTGNTGRRGLVYGVYGLVFDRDYEDDLFLVRNDAGQSLRSTDADVGNLGGLEFFLGTRNDNGTGLDLRYWGLFTNEANYTLTGGSFSSYIPDLANVTWPGNGRTILDVINGSTVNNIHRDNEIHNVEANLLRNAGCYTTWGGRAAHYELLAGLRWFEFDETFHWDITSPTDPVALYFDHNVQNTLLGFQLGGLSEICLSNRMSLNVGTKVGVFNNRSRVEQILQDDAGTFAVVDGAAYYFRNSKNDISMLGELNVGLACRLNSCSRLTIGYRALGVSGIALGPNQLNNFNYLAAITNIQSNANLLLHGTVFGFEFCR